MLATDACSGAVVANVEKRKAPVCRDNRTGANGRERLPRLDKLAGSSRRRVDRRFEPRRPPRRGAPRSRRNRLRCADGCADRVGESLSFGGAVSHALARLDRDEVAARCESGRELALDVRGRAQAARRVVLGRAIDAAVGPARWSDVLPEEQHLFPYTSLASAFRAAAILRARRVVSIPGDASCSIPAETTTCWQLAG